MKNKLDILLDEERFPCIGMDKQERNFYLTILKNCKDICDTNNKVVNQSNCQIIEMNLRKEGNQVNASGSVVIGTNVEKEYRTIEAIIYTEKTGVIVDMLVTRLKTQEERKKYRVLDEFYISDDILSRRSQYNYYMKSIEKEIINEDSINIIKFINSQNKKGRRK